MSKKIAVIGIGGHASTVLEAIVAGGNVCIGCFAWKLTNNVATMFSTADSSAKQIGDFDTFMNSVGTEKQNVICAIGDNEKRQNVVNDISLAYGDRLKWETVIHPRANVSPSATVGSGTIVAAHSVIQANATIGSHCIVNTSATIDHDCKIGDFVHCAPGSVCCGKVSIQEGVLVGAGARIIPECVIRAWSLVKAGTTTVESSTVIPIYQPLISESHKRAVAAAADAGWISWQGPSVKSAEKKLKAILGTQNVIVTSNGTTATHCLFLALRYKYPNINKIYVPNSVYVAAWNAVLYEYPPEAVYLLPLDEETWNVSTDDLVSKIPVDGQSAVLIVHNVGNIVNVPELKRKRPDLVFVEDACEGLFGEYEGKPAGSASFASSFSFFANKTVTCGEGGAFTTDDPDVADYVWRCCCQGFTEKRYIHSILAYNYRMTNLQAALLDGQLQDYVVPLDLKRKIVLRYEKGLENTPNVSFPKVDTKTKSANWMVAMRIKGASSFEDADKFFRQRFVEIRPMFYGMHRHAHLNSIAMSAQNVDERQLTLCEMLTKEVIMVPTYPLLKDREVDYIIRVIRQWAENCNKDTQQ